MSKTTIQLDPKTTTVINDGQFRYPVSTAALQSWIAANGPISTKNYNQFCDQVDHLMPGVMPGSEEMINECQRLMDAGANVKPTWQFSANPYPQNTMDEYITKIEAKLKAAKLLKEAFARAEDLLREADVEDDEINDFLTEIYDAYTEN